MDWWMLKAWIKDLFDFSQTVPMPRKIFHIFLALGVDVFWTVWVSIFMALAFNLSFFDIKQIISSNIAIGLFEKINLSIDARLKFFLACIMAPLWEESIFRYFSIRFAQFCDALIKRAWMLLPMVLLSSIVFGILHGTVFNILFQGVGGLIFCWLYLKNNNSFWSVVAAHGLWNLGVLAATRFA